ncbi:hypothetical protein LC613_20180 [Nostoc sphaeroides CHAB 2801]|nr:hypothetical protein [Nostoc sphaeroides]MCC5630209.1 hypothetical protein [Nostoc sphaeroides CHAB 2801]
MPDCSTTIGTMLLGLLNWELMFIRLWLLMGLFADCDTSIQAFFDDNLGQMFQQQMLPFRRMGFL